MRDLFEEMTTRVKFRREASPAMWSLLDSRGLNGPPSLWLLSPGVGGAFEAMQGAIRSTMSLTPRQFEIIVLMVGSHHRSEFEIFAHRMAAKAVGITDEEIAAILSGGDPGFSEPGDVLAAELTRSMLTTADLEDTLFERAVAHIGNRGVFEITVVVGFYSAIALQLQVFRVSPE